jgi:hypothetical protein
VFLIGLKKEERNLYEIEAAQEGKRVVFPSGIRAGLSLTMLSWLRLRERDAVFVEVGRLQRSGG